MADKTTNDHDLATISLAVGASVGLYVWRVFKGIVEGASKTQPEPQKLDWETYEIPTTPPRDQAGRLALLKYAPEKVAPRRTVVYSDGSMESLPNEARSEVFRLAKAVATSGSLAQAQAALNQIHQLVARFPAPPSTPADQPVISTSIPPDQIRAWSNSYGPRYFRPRRSRRHCGW